HPPVDLKLHETVATQLVQLDVTLQGPTSALQNLGATDFTLVVGGHLIEGLIADGSCSNESPVATPVTRTPATHPTPANASYLFYFDQEHLTFGGRARSLQVAHELIPKLVASGARAEIVSSAATFTTYASWTRNEASLLEAIARLKADALQSDAS